jgi:hypothetical protein
LNAEDKALLIGSVLAALFGVGTFLSGNPEYAGVGVLILSIAAALKAYLRPPSSTPPPPVVQ